jgi:phosphate-selective porin OprO/OprP
MKHLLLLTVIALATAPFGLLAQDEPQSSTETAPQKPQESTQSPANTSPQQAPNTNATSPNGTLVNTIEAGESDDEVIETPRKLVHWNEYQGPYFGIRAGGGLLYEFAGYAQDKQSKQQFALDPDFKLRDFRFLLKGNFGKLNMTWSTGIMYDAPSSSWLMRETGIMIPVPKLLGNLFIGRTKEGFSLNKVMVGYAGWTLERFTMNDASIPILADGIKWLGYSPKHGFLWNLGIYNDFLSKNQTFSTFSTQGVARLIWLPIHSDEEEKLFHVGLNLRYGTPEDGKLQLRSRPEAFPAPYFVDTGKFAASAARNIGYEIYYRAGPWLFGSEYWIEHVSSPSTHNPLFNGGDVVATWLITGEARAYNTVGGFFKAVSPARPVGEGGPGAWELVFRLSNIDLDSGTLNGGKFLRFTPAINWYLSNYVRLSFSYGYGYLDRFNLKGNTQFFQSRLQFQL